MMKVDAIVEEIVEGIKIVKGTVGMDGFEQRNRFQRSPMERHTK